MTEKFNKKTQAAFKDFEPENTKPFSAPTSETEAKEFTRDCFSRDSNAYQPTPEQQYFIAFLIRFSGYRGRLIVNGYGQFYQDLKDFYVDGLKQYFEMLESDLMDKDLNDEKVVDKMNEIYLYVDIAWGAKQITKEEALELQAEGMEIDDCTILGPFADCFESAEASLRRISEQRPETILKVTQEALDKIAVEYGVDKQVDR